MARSSVEDLFRTRAADYGKAMVKKDKKEKTRIINEWLYWKSRKSIQKHYFLMVALFVKKSIRWAR